jgi:hypothetical protein
VTHDLKSAQKPEAGFARHESESKMMMCGVECGELSSSSAGLHNVAGASRLSKNRLTFQEPHQLPQYRHNNRRMPDSSKSIKTHSHSHHTENTNTERPSPIPTAEELDGLVSRLSALDPQATKENIATVESLGLKPTPIDPPKTEISSLFFFRT